MRRSLLIIGLLLCFTLANADYEELGYSRGEGTFDRVMYVVAALGYIYGGSLLVKDYKLGGYGFMIAGTYLTYVGLFEIKF